MDVKIDRTPTHLVARLTGELTLATRERASAALTALFEENDRRVAIDLSGIKYIDSSGLGCLVDLNARANVAGCRMMLVAPSAFVAGVLENTRLDRWFEIAPSHEAAVAKFQAAKSA